MEILRDFPEFRQYLSSNQSKGKVVGHWTSTWIGYQPSLEWSVQMYYLAEKFVRGDPSDPSNPLQWDKIVLNLPSSPSFNPGLPNVFKID